VGAALVVHLVNKGGQADAAPGRDISVVVGGTGIEPFGILRSPAEGKLTASDWQGQCGELDLTAVDLGHIVVQAEDHSSYLATHHCHALAPIQR
jgi:hypothetical protein